MSKKRGKRTLGGVLAALLGFACALLLGALLYGAMVYQLAGEKQAPAQSGQGLLSLSGVQLLETAQQERQTGGALCTLTTRVYQLENGAQARAITATPAVYLERLSEPGVVMQLITGFVIDDLDALYAREGETGILAARSGDTVYMIEAVCDEQTLYALGAGARRGAQTDSAL